MLASNFNFLFAHDLTRHPRHTPNVARCTLYLSATIRHHDLPHLYILVHGWFHTWRRLARTHINTFPFPHLSISPSRPSPVLALAFETDHHSSIAPNLLFPVHADIHAFRPFILPCICISSFSPLSWNLLRFPFPPLFCFCSGTFPMYPLLSLLSGDVVAPTRSSLLAPFFFFTSLVFLSHYHGS